MDKTDKEVLEHFDEKGKRIKNGSIGKVHRSKLSLEEKIKPDEECLTYDEEGYVIYRYKYHHIKQNLSYGAFNRFIDIDEEISDYPFEHTPSKNQEIIVDDDKYDPDMAFIEETGGVEIPNTSDNLEKLLDETEVQSFDVPDLDEDEEFIEKLNEDENLEKRIRKMD